MTQLKKASVLNQLEEQIQHFLPLQIDDPSHPKYGAVLNPSEGMTAPWQAERLIKMIAYQSILSNSVDETLFNRANLAADQLIASQRSSGLLDFPGDNIDSSPNTGFSVQALAALYDVSRGREEIHHLWAALLNKIEVFIRKAVPALVTGGFHVPNHRWVLTSAMAYAHHLFPDLEVANAVEAYLAEEFDIDDDGTYIERSIGVNDTVNGRSLLLIGEYWNRPDAFDVVAKNVEFALHMLHDDGTAVNNLSTDNEFEPRKVPEGLIACLLLLNHHRPDPKLEFAASYLYKQSIIHSRGVLNGLYWDFGHLDWIAYALVKSGEPKKENIKLPEDFSRYFPVNGIWRVRRKRMSASIFKGRTDLMSLNYGAAELSSISVSFTYFGKECGWFIGDEFKKGEDYVILHSTGRNHPRRPAYELPLGRPVPPNEWESSLHERDLRHLPPLVGKFKITEVRNGFDLHLTTEDGLDNIAGQIAFDFAPNGVWETDDTRAMIAPGHALFLKQGTGTMRYGNDVIQISPGCIQHGLWEMRAAQPAPDHVRVLLTFFTPIDHLIYLRVFRGWQNETWI